MGAASSSSQQQSALVIGLDGSGKSTLLNCATGATKAHLISSTAGMGRARFSSHGIVSASGVFALFANA